MGRRGRHAHVRAGYSPFIAKQANFLLRAHLYRGDFRVADLFVDELREVTPEDVQRVARQYMRNVRFAYVGDSQRLSTRALKGF